MYTWIGKLDEPSRLALLAQPRQWSHCKGELTDYWSDDNGVEMFVKICPGGKVHKHTDSGKQKTHWVLLSNDKCESWSNEVCYRLEQGGIYLLDVDVPHESFNYGTTDRIHLIR